ncbi:MAG: hypothetical protein DRN47_02460 [Candidatus Wolframiiraptor sp.]|nr:MAG: hypothetical protein DRN47_02460 [Candidatus Wolframiiraptor sp.]
MRNVKKGLLTRSRIVELLSEKAYTMSQLAEEIGLSESSIRRHLNNMLAEGIVEKIKYRGKVLWRLSGYGQLDLDESAA